MKYRSLLLRALAALSLFSAASASASLIGTSVTGSLQVAWEEPNYFDPANGYVSAGYLNASGSTVVIGAGIEFGYFDTANLIVANFTATQLTITNNTLLSNTLPWSMVFTNSAFTSLSLVSSDFSPDLNYSLVGNMMTINWAGTLTTGLRTAVFDVGSASSVPDSGTTATLTGIALLGLVAFRRKLG
jgi:hypothetical protein